MMKFPQLSESRAWLEGASLPEALPARVAVGWSGGADSTALLLALASAGYEVCAWHVDHGWHEHSARQADELAARADAWGIPFSVARLPVPSGTNREAEARAGRYEVFAGLSREQGINALCLAHHRDDQAETVMMRMLQGAGVHGIRGMQPLRLRNGMKLFRPFLHLSRQQLRSGLERAGVQWLEDESNGDMSLWRNRLRKRLFPAMERCGADPSALFLRWQKQAVILSARVDAACDHVQLDCGGEDCSLPWNDWRSLPATARASLLQRMMQRLFGDGIVAGRRHIELIETWMQQGGYGGLDLSRSRILRKDGRLRLLRKA